MKDVGEITRVKPDARVNALMRFNKRLSDNQEVKNDKSYIEIVKLMYCFLFCQIMQELSSWGLKFSPNLVECPARMIPAQTIIQTQQYMAVNGDWSRNMQSESIYIYCIRRTNDIFL